MQSISFRRPYAQLVLLGLAALTIASVAVRPYAAAPSAFGGGVPVAALAGSFGPTAASHASGGLAWPSQPSPPAALAELQARAAGPLDVRWDKLTGIPEWLAAGDPDQRIPYTPSAAERGNPVAIARGFLDENRALFRLRGAADELTLLRVEPDRQRGYAHVRLAQVFHGIPVFGKQVIVHLDPSEQIVAVNGQLAPAIEIATQPVVGQALAEDLAARDMVERRLELAERDRARPSVVKDATRLMVYVDRAGKPTLAWRVKLVNYAPLGEWTVFVNARRPAVVHAIEESENAMRRQTFSADNTTELPGRLMIDEGEASRRDPIAQAAHDAAGTVYQYYFDTFQRDAYDDRGSPMVSTVHFGSDPEEAENAAWIGELEQMIYGDGGRIFRPLAYGLDVVGHEFTHGVIDTTADLIYEAQPGALNESYADVFGALIDRGNWIVGEDVVQSPPFPLPYLRSLEDPNAEGSYNPRNPLAGVGQPANMREYANLPISRRADNGGVHINSGIPNRAAFLVAQTLGPERMEQIYYRTMTQYLSPQSDFFDAASATARAAADLYDQEAANAVRGAFAQVGIDIGGPDTSPTPPGEAEPQQPTTPPPAPDIPQGCAELVQAGDFESDDGWNQVTAKGGAAIIDTELPRTGSRSAWLGGTDEEPFMYIYQDVGIPANATQVTLSYYRLLHEETTGVLGALLSAEARFDIVIANTQGDTVAELETLSSTQGDDRWRQATFDLSRLAGKTARLVFAVENPPGNVSSMFVDDVSMVGCTTGSGPAAPPTTSGDQVYLQGTIADASTGRGINGAQIFFMQPGLSASEAAADDNLTSDEVITLGTTDGNGLYQSEQPVPRGQVYSVIVIASGYRPIVADGGAEIPADAENPFPVDALLRRGR